MKNERIGFDGEEQTSRSTRRAILRRFNIPVTYAAVPLPSPVFLVLQPLAAVPWTDCCPVSVRVMDPNNTWFDDQFPNAQMWVYQGVNHQQEGKNAVPSAKRALAFKHVTEGRPFAAEAIHLSCEANFTIFIPHEDKDPELARMCIVVPDHEKPHCHPVPLLTNVSHAVAEKYKECVRKYGVGATVGKIEKGTCFCRATSFIEAPLALLTKEILGTSRALFHPALLNSDTKQKLINQVKDEGRSEAFQEAQGVVKHIHSVRSLDCDATFKPVIGKTNMYEWLMSVKEFFMDTRDRPAFKFIWEEFQRLVKRLSRPRKCKLASHSEQPDGRLPNLSAHWFLIWPFFRAYPRQRHRLNRLTLKGWGIQRNGVAMSATDYAKNHWNESQKEYPEYGCGRNFVTSLRASEQGQPRHSKGDDKSTEHAGRQNPRQSEAISRQMNPSEDDDDNGFSQEDYEQAG
ncbi:hypothetical protein C8R45DRAFT_924010 [Mycena sanguinolenta]|nr:hypothetical protein C8R45DRAFT_924010 [Mycena sanguinolenta]